MKFALIAIACVFTLSANSASFAEDKISSEATVNIAEQYIAAYSTFNTDNMAPFLADDVVFADPTSPDSILYEGKQAVIDGLGGHSAAYKEFSLVYEFERRYESNGIVVFIAQLTYNGVSKNDQSFTGTAPIVTAVTIKDGKVVKHVDYFDYMSNAIDTKSSL